jgi:hypothetical protein
MREERREERGERREERGETREENGDGAFPQTVALEDHYGAGCTVQRNRFSPHPAPAPLLHCLAGTS